MNQPPSKTQAATTPVSSSPSAKPVLIIIFSFLGLCGLCGLLSTIANKRGSKTNTGTAPTSASRARSTNSSSSSAPSHTSSTKSNATDQQASETSQPELEIISLNWVRGGLGAVAVWQLTIKNNTRKKIGDLKYETRYYSESDKQLGPAGAPGQTKHTLQIVIEPNETRTLEVKDGFTHSDVAKAQFDLKSWRFIK